MPSDQEKKILALFARIETIQFAVELGVSSGLKIFLHAVEAHPDFLLLQTVAHDQPELIIERMLRNSAASFDHLYENPFDTSAAVYYHALFTKSIHFYYAKAARILGYMSNTSWSKMIINPPHRAIFRSSKKRLGWRYWPTVYFYHAIHTIRSWWRNILYG